MQGQSYWRWIIKNLLRMGGGKFFAICYKEKLVSTPGPNGPPPSAEGGLDGLRNWKRSSLSEDTIPFLVPGEGGALAQASLAGQVACAFAAPASLNETLLGAGD